MGSYGSSSPRTEGFVEDVVPVVFEDGCVFPGAVVVLSEAGFLEVVVVLSDAGFWEVVVVLSETVVELSP